MISSNTRATRSRYSSPAQQPPQQQNGLNGSLEGGRSSEPSRGSANEGSRSFMEKWLEPAIQNKTSFEEAGLMRHGVLEGMAPLGTLPKAKKTGPDGNGSGSSVRRIILRQSVKSSEKPTQEASPAATPKTSTGGAVAAIAATDDGNAGDAGAGGAAASASAAEAAASASQPPPVSPTRTASISSRPQPRRSLPTQTLAPVVATVDADEEDGDYDPNKPTRRKSLGRPSLPKRGRPPSSARRSSMPSAKTSPVKQRAPTPPSPATHRPDFVEKVIEAAVDEALHHHRYPTAWALRTLYDEKVGDPDFVAMLEEVFTQTASAKTREEFARQVEEKKREGKHEDQGRHYFVPPADDGDHTPHPPKAAPYGRLLVQHNMEPSAQDEGERRASKKIKVSHKRSESNSTPRKMPASGTGAVNKTPGSRRKARRASGSSDSSLSSLEQLSSPELPAGSELVTSATLASPSLRSAAKAKAQAKAKAAKIARAAKASKGTQNAKAKTQAQAKASARASTSLSAQAQAQTQAKAGATGPQSPTQSAAPQPITTRRKSLASAKRHSHSNTSPTTDSPSISPSPTRDSSARHRHHQNPSAYANGSDSWVDDASMPGRLATTALDPFSIHDSKDRDKSSFSAVKGGPKVQTYMPDGKDEAWEKRREAQKITNGYTAVESSVRNADEEAGLATPTRSTRRTRQSTGLPSASTRATRSANKRAGDDQYRFASPGVLSVSASVQGDGSSAMGSRAVTPTNLRPAKKQKTGLRVKSSPVKKKGGTAAGVPRTVGEAQSATTGAAKDQPSENDELCSACGNAGDVVCCDGCPRSFHFECVDMIQSEDLPDEWYCNECLVKRYPSRVPIHKGVFGGPLNILEKSIPRAFSLPKRIQNRFEGVKAGADGDYEEVSTNKVTTRKKNNGYEEPPDFYKQREDGEAVICHCCQKAASDVRAIISCSVCPLHWHTDCLDPPLAVPPVLKTWKCPAHMDDVLSEAPALAPAHRYRKVKGAPVIATAFSRGLKNNGHIELDWGSEAEDTDNSGWREIASFGRTYKVPVRGVRLDFIEQLRKQGAGYAPRKDESRTAEPYLTPPVEDPVQLKPRPTVEDRSMEEMQASLVLSSLHSAPADGLEQLTSALLASASPNVISLIAQGDAKNIAQDQLIDHDKVSLRALLAQMENMSGKIRDILGEEPPPAPKQTLGAEETPSVATDSKCSVDKMDTEPLVTEPTPPSTIDHDGVMEFD